MSTPRSSSSSSSKMPEGKDEKKIETPLEAIEGLFEEIRSKYKYRDKKDKVIISSEIKHALSTLDSRYFSVISLWTERLKKLVTGKYPNELREDERFLSKTLPILLNDPEKADAFLRRLETMQALIERKKAASKKPPSYEGGNPQYSPMCSIIEHPLMKLELAKLDPRYDEPLSVWIDRLDALGKKDITYVIQLLQQITLQIVKQPQHIDMLLKRVEELLTISPKIFNQVSYSTCDSMLSILLTQADNDKITPLLCQAVSIAFEKNRAASSMIVSILKSGNPHMVSLAEDARNIQKELYANEEDSMTFQKKMEAKYPNYAPFYRLSNEIDSSVLAINSFAHNRDRASLLDGMLSLLNAGMNTDEEKEFLIRCSDIAVRLLSKEPTTLDEFDENEIVLFLDANNNLQSTYRYDGEMKTQEVIDDIELIFHIADKPLYTRDLELFKQLFQKNLPRRISSQEKDVNLTKTENDAFYLFFMLAESKMHSNKVGLHVSEIFNYLMNSEEKPSLATSENFRLLCSAAGLRSGVLQSVLQELKESKSLTQERFDEVMNAKFNTALDIIHWLKKNNPALALDEFRLIPASKTGIVFAEFRKLNKEGRLTIEACKEAVHRLTSEKVHTAVPVFPIDISKLTAAYTTFSPSDKVKKEEVPDEEENKKNKPS